MALKTLTAFETGISEHSVLRTLKPKVSIAIAGDDFVRAIITPPRSHISASGFTAKNIDDLKAVLAKAAKEHNTTVTTESPSSRNYLQIEIFKKKPQYG